MPFAQSVVGLVTALAGCITAGFGLLIAVRVNTVHHIVNQHRTDQRNFNAALIRQLEDHGIKPVIDQSLEPIDPEPV